MTNHAELPFATAVKLVVSCRLRLESYCNRVFICIRNPLEYEAFDWIEKSDFFLFLDFELNSFVFHEFRKTNNERFLQQIIFSN